MEKNIYVVVMNSAVLFYTGLFESEHLSLVKTSSNALNTYVHKCVNFVAKTLHLTTE